MANPSRTFNLRNRTEQFAADIVRHVNAMPDSVAGKHLGNQLLRSGTAPALHYGEASAAESRKDFVHKMKLALKELRESNSNLKIQALSEIVDEESVEALLRECDELERIFNRSIQTAKTNMNMK